MGSLHGCVARLADVDLVLDEREEARLWARATKSGAEGRSWKVMEGGSSWGDCVQHGVERRRRRVGAEGG